MLLEDVVAELARDLDPVVLAGLLVDVVALEVEVREVEGDAVLGRRHDLPDAVLVAGIGLGERGARDRPVVRVEDPAAGVYKNPKMMHARARRAAKERP